MLLGLLAVAWRLGGLERSVKDLGKRVDRLDRRAWNRWER